MSRYIDADVAKGEKMERYNNADLISRQDAIEAVIKRIEKSECGESVDHNKVLADIKSLPTANVVEVVHGEWIPIDVGDCCYRCSVCNFVRDAYLLEEDNYCPHCGARMDGEI